MLFEKLCLLPSQRLPRPFAHPPNISRRGSSDFLLRSFLSTLPRPSAYPLIISRPNAGLQLLTTLLAQTYYLLTIPPTYLSSPPNISRLLTLLIALFIPLPIALLIVLLITLPTPITYSP